MHEWKNVLVCIRYDVNNGVLDFDDQTDIVYFDDKDLDTMETALNSLNKLSVQDCGLEQYRIFARMV